MRRRRPTTEGVRGVIGRVEVHSAGSVDVHVADARQLTARLASTTNSITSAPSYSRIARKEGADVMLVA